MVKTSVFMYIRVMIPGVPELVVAAGPKTLQNKKHTMKFTEPNWKKHWQIMEM
jgi:hypothetical protein